MSHDINYATENVLTPKIARAIAKVQKALAKSQALREKMDRCREAADKAVAKLTEDERRIINQMPSAPIPELTYNHAMETVVSDRSWGDCHA